MSGSDTLNPVDHINNPKLKPSIHNVIKNLTPSYAYMIGSFNTIDGTIGESIYSHECSQEHFACFEALPEVFPKSTPTLFESVFTASGLNTRISSSFLISFVLV